MSGSAGGNRITRDSVAKTVDNYIDKVLKKFAAFKSAKISGSYNTSDKQDFGDVDLIVHLDSKDKKNIKIELAKFLSELPDDIIVPFKSNKYKGKKYLNTGEIITILYPIEGQPEQYVQIDNIISIDDKEAEFKKEFLDYPAEIQGLLLGLAKTVCLEENPKEIFQRLGIKNIPELEPNQEYEFNLSSVGLTLRIVTLDNFKEIDRTDVWKTSNWNDIKKLFINYKINDKFEDLLKDISSKLKNPRSKNRIKGIFKSMVSVKSGEIGTPKGDNKQKAIDNVNTMLSETNIGKYLVSTLLEQDQSTVALYPGKFKPPHKGHFEVVKKLLQNADKVIIFISPKTHENITANESAAVWELYKQKLGGNIETRISNITPVRDTYEFAENNPELKIYAAYGKGERDRYKTLEDKYPNAKIFDAGNFDNINATDFRKALRDNNEEEIKKFLPDGIEVNDFLKAMQQSKPTITEGRLDESQTATLGEFIKYAIKSLAIKKPPSGLTLSYDNNQAKDRSSFGYFDPNNNKIWVYVKNRNMADILRTLAHELVHRKQDEDGRISYESGETGSDIENEANAQAGVLLRDFGKEHKEIYESKEYGNYLFGDKNSGAKVGWYNSEKEKDTPAEKALFDLLKKYADSDTKTYSTINLDQYIPIFQILKKQYPEIADPNIKPDQYIYRGTSISKEQFVKMISDDKYKFIPYEQGSIIPNQVYSSKRKVQSWSTSYYTASGFAYTNAHEKGEIPAVMRAKASDAELFFNPKFMEKLNNQLEDETFNIINPINVDVMVIEEYQDEFEDIESSYLSNKV